ncbi:MAG: response regulator [Burkholderiaceae bacterium]
MSVPPAPGAPPLRLLVVEDSPLDYEMLAASLEMQGIATDSLRVDSLDDLLAALSGQAWDVVISDHHLPGFTSKEAFTMVRQLDNPPPFIIVSGVLGEDAAVEAMRDGADDYLLKGRLARLGMAVSNAQAASVLRREKARAEARLKDYQEQLSDLTAHLQTVVDEERASIAREIHDDIGGSLTALKFDLALIGRHADPAQRERAERAIGVLAHAAEASQRIMRNLRPPILDAGLVQALEWQVGQFRERSGMAVAYRSNVTAVDVEPTVAMAVYRTCQEALTNIVKHAAGATAVEVDLHYGDGLLSMEISDNGRGFEAGDLRKPTSFGLRGLAERARKVHGSLDFTSAAGRTTLMLWIPLTENAAMNFGESQS